MATKKRRVRKTSKKTTHKATSLKVSKTTAAAIRKLASHLR
jgi:hypothetical protein